MNGEGVVGDNVRTQRDIGLDREMPSWGLGTAGWELLPQWRMASTDWVFLSTAVTDGIQFKVTFELCSHNTARFTSMNFAEVTGIQGQLTSSDIQQESGSHGAVHTDGVWISGMSFLKGPESLRRMPLLPFGFLYPIPMRGGGGGQAGVPTQHQAGCPTIQLSSDTSSLQRHQVLQAEGSV